MILVLGTNLFRCAAELETARADIKTGFGLYRAVWNGKKETTTIESWPGKRKKESIGATEGATQEAARSPSE